MLPTFAVLLLAVAASWFIYHMLLQQGRFQIRLEILERDLSESGIGPQADSIGSHGGVPRHSLLPDFQLPVIGGGVTSLSTYRGRKVLLIFFNPRCCYSMHLAPDLQRINSRRIQQEPLPVVVSTGNSLDNERLFGKFPIGSSVLLQEGSEMATLYRVKGTPVGYLIDEDGRTEGDLMIGPEVLRVMLSRTTSLAEVSA